MYNNNAEGERIRPLSQMADDQRIPITFPRNPQHVYYNSTGLGFVPILTLTLLQQCETKASHLSIIGLCHCLNLLTLTLPSRLEEHVNKLTSAKIIPGGGFSLIGNYSSARL